MGRSHARVFTVIWDDPDFLALSGLAQRCYLMLLSQPNLGHAGVLPTTVRRWTLLCADEDEGRLSTAISELAGRRFVVVDERTEELLIRSLIRNDGVWKQPKVLAVAITEAASIRSAALRACVAEELSRIDCAELPDKTRPEVEVLLKDLPHRLVDAHLEGAPHPPPDPPANPPPHLPSMGDVDVVRVRAGAAPAPTTTPAVQLPAVAGGPRPGGGELTITQRSKRLTDAYAEAEPMCKWPAVNAVVIRAIKTEEWDDDEIRAALLRMAAENRSVTIDALRTELRGFAPPAGPGRREQERQARTTRALQRAAAREANS